MAGGGGSPQGGGQQGLGQPMGGFGGQPMGGMGGMGGQPMGGFGGQQGGFGNSFGGGYGGQQPQQTQQMQRPMQNQFGGFNQSPQMGGYGMGGGGFGGGFNQYNPMGGGYGMGGFNPQMGGMGGFGGGYGPQMGGFGMGMGGQPMGGYGGGFGGGFNQPPQMGGFGGGMQNSSINSFPDPRMRQNQGQHSGMDSMQGFRPRQSAYEGRPAPENNGGFGMGGMQGGQGLQGMSNILRGMPMGGMQQPNQNPAAQTNAAPMSFEDYKKQSLGFQDTGPAREMREKRNYEHYLNQQITPQQMQTGGGMGLAGGMQGQMGGMNQIPAYARPYAQQMMGNQNFSQMSIGRPNTDSGPAPALSLDQQYQNYLGSM